MYDIRNRLEEPWRSPRRLGGSRVEAARSCAAYALVLEAEVVVDGALDGLGPLLHRDHRHSFTTDVQDKTKVLRMQQIQEREREEEDVGCGRDKEKEENQIREMIIASTKVLR
jgi:hypothetical protein